MYRPEKGKRIVKPTVLYYNTQNPAKADLVKAALMQMGVCIRHISPDQVNETIGYLAGMEGFVPLGTSVFGNTGVTGLEKFLPIIKDEVLIMHNFTQEKLDELLYRLRSVNASVALKAVVTPTNCLWHFWQLYEELKEEHAQMAKQMQKKPRM